MCSKPNQNFAYNIYTKMNQEKLVYAQYIYEDESKVALTGT